jgi:type I restriction enzyme M protein
MLQEIKEILSGHRYMDVYSGYQIIADLWSSYLTRDLKFIMDSGFYEAAKLTEIVEAKGKKEPELRGRLISNEIVAEILYADRLGEIHKIEEQVQEKETEKAEWIEKAGTEDSDEAEILGDSLKEDKSDFDTKLLTSNAKEAKAGSEEKKMLTAVKKVYDEIKKLNKEIKDKETQLKKDVQGRYPNLTVPKIEKLYWRKWFEDINGRIVALVREPLDAELKDIEMLENRYAQTIDEMDDEIAAAEKELESMQAELVVG